MSLKHIAAIFEAHLELSQLRKHITHTRIPLCNYNAKYTQTHRYVTATNLTAQTNERALKITFVPRKHA